jgi:hypothetical protein
LAFPGEINSVAFLTSTVWDFLPYPLENDLAIGGGRKADDQRIS